MIPEAESLTMTNRDTIEPWELARWEAVTQTGKPTGRNAGAHESKLSEFRRHAILSR